MKASKNQKKILTWFIAFYDDLFYRCRDLGSRRGIPAWKKIYKMTFITDRGQTTEFVGLHVELELVLKTLI